MFCTIEFLELTLYHSTIPVQASQWISIARQRVSRVCYSFLQKKEVPLNLIEILKNSLTKVKVTVKGVPNGLYAQNMEYRHQYDEILKHFGEGNLKEVGVIQKDIQLHNIR